MHITLNLPIPPSVNTYYRNFRGIMVLSKAGRQFKAAVQDYVVEHNIPKFGASKVKLTMVLRPRDKRKIDIDNRIKAVLDSLEDAGVFDNDWQVDHIEMIRGTPIKNGAIHVLIEAIEDRTPPSSEGSTQSAG
jgi:crossover junction endodeoxyribonuclease RusA